MTTETPVTNTPTRRPGGITFLMVIGMIGGVLNVLLGVIMLIQHDNRDLLAESGLDSDTVVGTAIAIIIIGGVQFAIASALGRGSEVARVLFGIVATLNFGAALYAIVALPGEARGGAAFSLAFSAIVLYLLFGSSKDNEFFRTN